MHVNAGIPYRHRLRAAVPQSGLPRAVVPHERRNPAHRTCSESAHTSPFDPPFSHATEISSPYERALEHAPEDADEHGFVAGIRHVHSDLVAALQRAGIEQYSPAGEPFDPTLHEAIAQQPTEGAEPGTVVEVYQRGYRVGETVVRPARVVVAG